MSANFIKTWPCTINATAVSAQPDCPIAQIFGQSINKTTIHELYEWVNSYCKVAQLSFDGKFLTDQIHELAHTKMTNSEPNTAINFNWHYSHNTISTLRVNGLYINHNLVQKLCSTTQIEHFFDFSAIYDGCAIQAHSITT